MTRTLLSTLSPTTLGGRKLVALRVGQQYLGLMKRLIAIFVFAAVLAFGAEPASLKEVFAQVSMWRVTEGALDPAAPVGALRAQPTKESASAFLARVANGRSDADRKLAPKLLQANIEQVEALIFGPAESLAGDKASSVKALRAALKRISESRSADPRDQTEVSRLLGQLG